MNQVFVDVSQIETDSLPARPFPAHRRFRIHVSEEAYQTVWNHAKETLVEGNEIKEVGGILVGEVYRDSEGPYVEIKAAIVAQHTRNEGTEVTFTPETWAQVNQVKDDLYPVDSIVGWYHTHPRFGIFLSERDKFVHQHSFPQPWATAFVVDPAQDLEGFFVWSKGEISEVEEYWVAQVRKTPSGRHDDKIFGTEATPQKSDRASPRAKSLLAMGALLMAVLATAAFFYWGETRRWEEELLVARALRSQMVELDRVFQIANQLRRDLESMKQTEEGQEARIIIHRRMRELNAGLQRVGLILTVLINKFEQGKPLAGPKESNQSPEHKKP